MFKKVLFPFGVGSIFMGYSSLFILFLRSVKIVKNTLLNKNKKPKTNNKS